MNETDELRYYQTHPPRCLARFEVRLAEITELPDAQFDGHAPFPFREADFAADELRYIRLRSNTIFAVRCRCGGDRHFIHGYRWRYIPEREPIFGSPFVLECATCQTTNDLFDARIHGFDAEQGMRSDESVVGEPAIFECEHCGRQPFETFARFEYPGQLLGSGIPQFEGRGHDMFSWFTLVGKCSHCAELWTVGDFECA